MIKKKQEELLVLMKDKDEMESLIVKLQLELSEYEKKGYGSNLVDNEGFPRADLDFGELAHYKGLKKSLSEKHNDLGQLMNIIEKALHALHESYREEGNVEEKMAEYEKNLGDKTLKAQQIMEEKEYEPIEKEIIHQPPIEIQIKSFLPFAEITEVSAESPAELAGLRVFDLIARFGDCDYRNNNKLSYLPEIVKAGMMTPIELEVYRKAEKKELENDVYLYNSGFYKQVTLQIIPKTWKGQGVLGCRFKHIC